MTYMCADLLGGDETDPASFRSVSALQAPFGHKWSMRNTQVSPAQNFP